MWRVLAQQIGHPITENKSNQLVLRQTKMYLIASQQVKISIYIIFPFLPKAFFYHIGVDSCQQP